MGILDSDTVIVDAILTKLGRNKLRQGQPLGITQYSFGDTGVDYTLYNPDHPSGSDSYGSAITSLPMLEAVPDDDVFLRSQLYGTGERGIQNYGFIDLPDGKVRTISHIPGGITSTAVTLAPRAYQAGQQTSDTTFKYTILDHRGLTATLDGSVIRGNAFYSPTPDKRSGNGATLEIKAQDGQITSQVTRTIVIELPEGGAAPAVVTLPVQPNFDTTSGDFGGKTS